jgi:hypothetical protein
VGKTAVPRIGLLSWSPAHAFQYWYSSTPISTISRWVAEQPRKALGATMSESNTQPAVQSVLKQKTPADPSPHPKRGIPQHSELAFPGVLLGAAFVVGIFGVLAIMLTAAASFMKREVGQTYSELLA